MEKETIYRILRQLLEHNYTGDIHPFLNNEPSLDSRMVNIVKSIRRMFPNNYIRIVSNGAGLSKDKVYTLFRVGLNSIHFNHYDGPYASIKKTRDLEFEGMTHFGLESILPSFYNRAGKVDYAPDKKQKRCENFIHKLVFNWKGDLILCCSDFNGEVVFGNINDQPLSIIMASRKYREYYYAHREGSAKELPLCKECNLI
jgi:radical SAM protein with 4Fe4S-binding SPASM domain